MASKKNGKTVAISKNIIHTANAISLQNADIRIRTIDHDYISFTYNGVDIDVFDNEIGTYFGWWDEQYDIHYVDLDPDTFSADLFRKLWEMFRVK